MDFYSILLDKKLGGRDDLPLDFNLYVNRNLTTVTTKMLDGLTKIGDGAFRSCTSLTSIEIPNSVTNIGDSAFYGCSSLPSIEIPPSVNVMGNLIFYYCNNLTRVTVRATTPPTLGYVAFAGTASNLVIYVPSGSVNAYKAATNWKNYASQIQAIPS